MKLRPKQMAAAVDLLKRRIEERGGPAAARAEELCAVELKGWLAAGDLMAAYRPDTAPGRWVHGEHDRRLDYYDPQTLAAKVEAVVVQPPEDSEREAELEAIAMVLRKLEAGGGLLRRKVKWRAKYYSMQTGERVEMRKGGPGQADCTVGGRVEWLIRAVLIMRGDVVVKAFPEARAKNMRPAGWCGHKKPMVEMRVPELVASELALRRISTSVAVLLLRLRRVTAELRSGAAIARAAGVTRANVSARGKRMDAEKLTNSNAEQPN